MIHCYYYNCQQGCTLIMLMLFNPTAWGVVCVLCECSVIGEDMVGWSEGQESDVSLLWRCLSLHVVCLLCVVLSAVELLLLLQRVGGERDLCRLLCLLLLCYRFFPVAESGWECFQHPAADQSLSCIFLLLVRVSFPLCWQQELHRTCCCRGLAGYTSGWLVVVVGGFQTPNRVYYYFTSICC